VAIYEARATADLPDACGHLLSLLPLSAPTEHAAWHCQLMPLDFTTVLSSVSGVARVAFKSRDRDFEFVGIGIADVIKANDGLATLIKMASSLSPNQFYFGGMRFDEDAEISEEWQIFGKKTFILPLVVISRKNAHTMLSLTYRVDGPTSWPAWRDFASSILNVISKAVSTKVRKFAFDVVECLPHQNEYAENIHRALFAFKNSDAHKKVVIGRRKVLHIKDDPDPIALFLRLKEKTKDAFLFFLDCGFQSAFFGASPELLYRRSGRNFETESLAGTRPRSSDRENDVFLRDELFCSFKDNREHALVSFHVEEKLRDFGTTDLLASQLEIMVLPYVQHLLRRYRGIIGTNIDDKRIIEALHPTPAVCGLATNWAKQFIRENESFDRGFYAGPIGYIGKDDAEFAVAIRSALFRDQNLYIYAACGIVPGSVEKQEWEELNNKEKNILSIFGEDHEAK
jgi:menaquinone-specific isochorismate synthase